RDAFFPLGVVDDDHVVSLERGPYLVSPVAHHDDHRPEERPQRGIDGPLDQWPPPPFEQRLRCLTTEARPAPGGEERDGRAHPARSGPARSGAMRTMQRWSRTIAAR